MERCEQGVHKYCQKLENQVPFPIESQNCHFETKKVCEVQHRVRPKKVKKLSYSTDCKAVPREVCESTEVKKLVPSCVDIDRLRCSYSPQVECREEPKQFCHKVEQVMVEEICETKGSSSYL